MNIDISLDKNQLKGVESMLRDIKNGAKKAHVTAINKTLTTTRVQVRKRIGQDINLAAKRINQELDIEKANYSKISGRFVAYCAPIGLINFGANQTAKGVTYKIYKSGGRQFLKHAFIAESKGANNVWWRGNRASMPEPKRYPIGKKSKAAWPKFGPKEGAKYRFPAGPKGDKGIVRRTWSSIGDHFSKPEIFEPEGIKASALLLKNLDEKVEEILRRHRG